MSVFGSVLQGVGSIFGGMAASAQGKSQFNQLNKAAEQTRREGGIGSGLVTSAGRRQAADLVVNAAASGGGTSGSSLDVLKDLERQVRFQAVNTTISAENKARNLNYEARVAKRQGMVGELTGFLNAGASFLNAADQMGGSSSSAAAGG
ncbi:hypothetical protein [Asticcacaulis taihuensis]|uniref:hypothetical protein n=1 Tax=Asticcacaulis taihuensis TaxID=260084 RepID=UPI0026ED21A1|nr:hypothetical protein [Asticcacaulis taihuensis]